MFESDKFKLEVMREVALNSAEVARDEITKENGNPMLAIAIVLTGFIEILGQAISQEIEKINMERNQG
jgi:hypothetical protein